MMFVMRNTFTEYKPITPQVGDSAKAKNGNFEIVGEGSIVQKYQVDGKEWEITYTQALHTPTLNVKLVSISALDKAGLTSTFGNGKGVTRKANGSIVLMSQKINGMYLLETVEGLPTNPMAMTSLSQPTSLEQWHQCLTHCSSLTIKDMVNKGLVDGLDVSEASISGKCKNCIMGRQTCCLFDGETDDTTWSCKGMDLCILSMKSS